MSTTFLTQQGDRPIANESDYKSATLADLARSLEETVPSLACSGKSGPGAPVRRVAVSAVVPRPGASSHHVYAAQTLQHLTQGNCSPVSHQGDLYVVDPATALWTPLSMRELVRTVAELHDGKHRCTKSVEYVGIAEHAHALASDEAFFKQAPTGIAAQTSFYSVEAGTLRAEVLAPSHRQRVMLEYEPAHVPTPLFERFLHQTFRSDQPGEEDSQVRLVQEIAGAVLLGIMPRFQKAVLFYDPYGRAGKGTMERIIRCLVPEQFISALSPFKWNREYFLAALVGKRLNVVGELPDGEPISAADFKSVIGGDMLAGRHPAGRVIAFQNDAAHLFTSNYLITTRDQSEAFFSRWLLVEFPNSLLKQGLTPDPDLSNRIISQEMPGIAYWALKGAIRLLKQGRFSSSTAHERLMAKWKQSASSVDEFFNDACQFGEGLHERRSVLYGAYRVWCQDNGRKPHSNRHMKELMEHRVGLRVRFTKLDGYDIVRGIAINKEFRDSLDSISL